MKASLCYVRPHSVSFSRHPLPTGHSIPGEERSGLLGGEGIQGAWLTLISEDSGRRGQYGHLLCNEGSRQGCLRAGNMRDLTWITQQIHFLLGTTGCCLLDITAPCSALPTSFVPIGAMSQWRSYLGKRDVSDWRDPVLPMVPLLTREPFFRSPSSHLSQRWAHPNLIPSVPSAVLPTGPGAQERCGRRSVQGNDNANASGDLRRPQSLQSVLLPSVLFPLLGGSIYISSEEIHLSHASRVV